MANVEVDKGSDPNCRHNWTRRDKVTFQILTRVCTSCGKVEHVNDSMDEKQIKALKGE